MPYMDLRCRLLLSQEISHPVILTHQARPTFQGNANVNRRIMTPLVACSYLLGSIKMGSPVGRGSNPDVLPKEHHRSDDDDDEQAGTGHILAKDVFMTDPVVAAKTFVSGAAFSGVVRRTTSSPVEVKQRARSPIAPLRLRSTVDPATMQSSPASAANLEPGISASVRTIDFTRLPSSARRFRFPEVGATPHQCPLSISIVRKEEGVKVQKKIAFAEHATVRVYEAPDADAGQGSRVDQIIETRAEPKTAEDDEDDSPNEFTRAVTQDRAVPVSNERVDLDSRTDPLVTPVALKEIHPDGDTVTLNLEQVHAIRKHFLSTLRADEPVEQEDGRLAALFELGKSFRGLKFDHEW
ncbi:hypothetical protein F5I97DRAFT_112531 [Phlebopus sp. FC_14]|nr:hypothetical protein F5I97DRAFT_112531 [Phlebopus sp. FC_14]